MTQSRSLSAVEVVYPEAGSALIVAAAQVLVFAEQADGRRLPLAVVDEGDAVVGCDPADGVRMLVTGINGSRILPVDVADLTEEQVLAWASRLSHDVAAGRWPGRLLSVDRAGSMVSPGEHIGVAEGEDLAWARVTGGTATWCGNNGAELRPGSAPVLLTRETWLTAGLRCRVVPAEPPATAEQRALAMAELGHLALGAAVWRREQSDAAAVPRLEQRSANSAIAAEEAVDVLTSAVGGHRRIPTMADYERRSELAAALTVADAYGLVLDEEAVQRAASELQTGRDALAAVAAACEARPNSVHLREDWWHNEGTPMLVRVSEGSRSHRPFAAVWSGRWELIDPATGDRQVVDAGLAEQVDLRAQELVRVLPSEPVTLRSLARLALHGSRREVIITLLLTAVLAGMAFITPYLLGQLSNVLFSDRPTSAFSALFAALLLVAVAGICFQAVRSLSMLRARSKAAAVSATAVWERVMRQPATWHSKRSLGDRLTQAGAVNNASAAMPDQTVAQVLDISFVLGSLAAIATTNATMLFALGALLAVQAVITVVILRAVERRAQTRMAASSVASTTLMETFAAVNRLRVAGAESRAFLRWASVHAPFVRADQSLRKLTMVQGVLLAIWPLLTLVVIVIVSAATDASFGAFVTAQTAAAGATAAISATAAASSAAIVARQSLRQAAPALESVPEGGLEGASPGAISGNVEARDLVFRYSPDGPAVLDRVSIAVRPGEHVAVVGPSGCGKTTLMRVLLGLEHPESGVISVDGRDLDSMNQPAVRRQIGSVLQSSSLLPCSIKDNVDMGRGLSQDQIWDALGAAGLQADVRTMAMGIETMVTDGGGTLSGGQRQRVLIARALAGHPRMLILDEATSALDNVTQAAVVESLAKLRITRIVVAHRLSTIRDADRIIVMQAGRVIDEGTFDELAGRPGVFRELVERQNA